MKGVNVCFRHYKSARLGLGREFDVNVHVFNWGWDWCFELWLVIDDFEVTCLFRVAYSGWEDFVAHAEVQGRKDDLEEKALLDFHDWLQRRS